MLLLESFCISHSNSGSPNSLLSLSNTQARDGTALTQTLLPRCLPFVSLLWRGDRWNGLSFAMNFNLLQSFVVCAVEEFYLDRKR